MRKAVLAVLIVLGATVVLAQGPGGPPDGPPGGLGGREDPRFVQGFRGPPSPLLDALDTNRDGELSAQEIDNAPAALRKLDKNKDGKLSASELMPQGMGMGPGGPGGPMDRRNQGNTKRNTKTGRDARGGEWDDVPMPGDREGPRSDRGGFRGPPSPLLEALDTNGDGEFSAEEIDNAAAALRKLDKNKDGKLTIRELMPQGMGMGPGGPGGPMDRRNQGNTRRNANARDREPTQPMDREDGPPPGDRDDRSVRNRDARGPGGMGGFSRDLAMFDKSPVAKDEAEEKILTTLAEMSRQRTPGGMNVPTKDGRILRVLAESIGAKHVVEIGTSTGYSTVWLCVALRQTGGKITTFEIDAERAAKARENFAKAGVTSLVTLIEGDAHEKAAQLKDPIDLLFIDADKEGYLDYVKKLLPLVRPGGLIVSHNMNERQADPNFVNAVTGSPKLETVFLNLESSGMGVTLKKR